MSKTAARFLTLALLALIAAVQYPLWFGKGSWRDAHANAERVEAQKKINRQLESRNRALDAEVRDLKSGSEAIEERARSDLGLVKPGEIYFQVPKETGADK
ncbi:MAG: cell division protein FtsB [Burkholderiales bacterium]|nr:cell division protein FtsB [Burkholderiales bacterium]MDQ3195077.1 cell division protein FtsB [Pseudomonadota bacterium]